MMGNLVEQWERWHERAQGGMIPAGLVVNNALDSLQPGQAVDLPDHLLGYASIEDLPMLDRLNGPRKEFTELFVHAVSAKFRLRYHQRLDGKWTFYRPEIT